MRIELLFIIAFSIFCSCKESNKKNVFENKDTESIVFGENILIRANYLLSKEDSYAPKTDFSDRFDSGNNEYDSLTNETPLTKKFHKLSNYNLTPPKNCDTKYSLLRLSHHINTNANEYLPCYDINNKNLYFTAMDRTGFFKQKIDFTKTRDAGGEDIYVSKMQSGLFSDAMPIGTLNTNGHESISQVLSDGSLILSGNYQENIGPDNDENGSATADLFRAVKAGNEYRIEHFEEPVNSIFTELDGFIPVQKDIMLFVSDRPKGVGAYHKKGWMWNANYWGNTDIYVAFSENGSWINVLNLGNKVNTPFAERTPYLSDDGLKLYISSNGYKEGKTDMDIYYFIRKDKNNWTDWDGPYFCKSLNSDKDDWGFKEYGDISFFARSEELKFIPTAKARNGTGFIFENNFRSGYNVTGAQSGSFASKEQTDIFMAFPPQNPSIVLPDALFDFDKSVIKKDQLTSFSEKLLDVLKMNSPKKIRIEGHTDSKGSNDYNMTLSLKRAESVMKIITESGFDSGKIMIKGLGSSIPVADNKTESGRVKNRRVEVFFEF